jgi:hypothetical protein
MVNVDSAIIQDPPDIGLENERNLIDPSSGCSLIFTHVVKYANITACWQLRLQGLAFLS